MIRDAVNEDLTELVVMGERFFAETQYGRLMDYSVEHTMKTLSDLIEGDTGILKVLDADGIKGMAGAVIYPFYMTGELTGQELFWWCEEKGKGLDLLAAIESQAKDNGAKSFTMMSLDAIQPERLDRIYTQKGYVRSEHTYIKGL